MQIERKMLNIADNLHVGGVGVHRHEKLLFRVAYLLRWFQ